MSLKMDLLGTVEVVIPQCRYLSIIYLLSKPYLLIIDRFFSGHLEGEQAVNTTLTLSYCKVDMSNVFTVACCTSSRHESIFEYFWGCITGYPKYVNPILTLILAVHQLLNEMTGSC